MSDRDGFCIAYARTRSTTPNSSHPLLSVPPSTNESVLLRVPNPATMYEENLLHRFLDFFTRGARRSSWLLKLHDLKDNPSALALRSGLRAVTLAYAAHATRDAGVKLAAYKDYGASLNHQRAALTRLQTVDYQSAINALLATVILSYFELVCCTTSTAWSQHTTAAEKLITRLGPVALKHDLIPALFYSVRSHAVSWSHRLILTFTYNICRSNVLSVGGTIQPSQKMSGSKLRDVMVCLNPRLAIHMTEWLS